jgi:hypothetical protein
MMRPNNSPSTDLHALRWGNRAAMTLQHDWVGWVQKRSGHELILVDNDSNVIRLVTPETDDGPLNVVIPSWRAVEGVNEGRYVMCVHKTLWFGNLAVHLPDIVAWDSTLFWQAPTTLQGVKHAARHLALLADWLFARAPEGTIAALVPELLLDNRLTAVVSTRTDLPLSDRTVLVNATEVLSFMMPALTDGDMSVVEQGARQLVGLGDGTFPVGAALLIGLVAGLRFWNPFLDEGSGLHPDGVTHRLTRGHLHHTTFLGNAMLLAADNDEWEARWHSLHAALAAPPRADEQQREYLRMLATAWIEHDPDVGSASLAGLLLPFLWHQHHISAN